VIGPHSRCGTAIKAETTAVAIHAMGRRTWPDRSKVRLMGGGDRVCPLSRAEVCLGNFHDGHWDAYLVGSWVLPWFHRREWVAAALPEGLPDARLGVWIQTCRARMTQKY
jgi:hypothetical protein